MAGHVDPALVAKLAIRSQHNHESMIAFAIAIACFAGLFIIARLIQLTHKSIWVPSVFIAMSRKFRHHFLIKTSSWFPSTGHLCVILAYLAINGVVTFTNMDDENLPFHSNIASRSGWMAIGNLLIVVILAMKNTPLAYLVGHSYDQLNLFHRAAGYTTMVFIIIHSCSYASYFSSIGRISRLTTNEEIFGMVAGFSFLIMAISGGLIRRWCYELFYYLHVGFWALAIIMVGLHQPELTKKVLIITATAASIWLLDRFIRSLRLILYSTNNTVTLTPLPHGGTRVTLTKPPKGAQPGKHCFLMIPSIRLCEAHPFTIAATQPLEFVVASYDGFTCDLHEAAVRQAGVALRASVEGAYGTFPEGMMRDKVVLVAGGSGASFTVGVALDMLRKMGDASKTIEFIWMVRDQSYVTWFEEHLKTLKNDPRINVRVFVTRSSSDSLATTNTTIPAPEPVVHSSSTYERADPEKATVGNIPKITIPAIDTIIEQEKMSPVSPTSPTNTVDSSDIPVIYERPNVYELVKTAIEETPKDKSVLVMSCGPEELMTVVRNTTAVCIQTDGPSVELHCEHFGW
ncbi:Fc.00g101880.m01.CDS01 [Cosmosporella sp. VM-42]